MNSPAIFDFLPVIRTLIFDANVRRNAVNITIVNDPLTELEESFRASLTRDPLNLPGEVMINPDSATVRILDDDGELEQWVRNLTANQIHVPIDANETCMSTPTRGPPQALPSEKWGRACY